MGNIKWSSVIRLAALYGVLHAAKWSTLEPANIALLFASLLVLSTMSFRSERS